ncbi:MAG: AAA family ATPase, partial [Kiloniellales bacterium]
MSRATLSRREASSLPEAAAARLYVRRLALVAFRNYAAVELAAEGRPLVLTGANGAGKTNLLEALSFLAPGRGLRNARLSEVDRCPAGGQAPGDQPWAVAAELETPEGARSIGTGREASDPDAADPASTARERRLVKIDGAFVRGQQALAEILAVVWLVPQMDGLFRDSPGGRRRFLDRLVYGFDPAHAGRVAAYEQALRERSRLLKNGPADAAWLSALEDTMARHGIAIAAARRGQVERLNL